MIFHRLTTLVAFYGILTVNSEEAKKGCKTEDGKEVEVDEQYDIPGYCYYNVCKGNNEWFTAACGLLGVPYGWSSTPEDPSKGYPACCAQPLPPLDIVPDILDKNPGTQYVGIKYSDNVEAQMGNELTPTQVKAEPLVNYGSWAESGSYYLLIMVDPDVPSRQTPEDREYVQWMVANIPGSEVKSGEVIVEYVGAAPAPKTGLHRNFFLVFKQPGKLTFDEQKIDKTSVRWRKRFSTKKFAQKYGLGSPEAINVFQAQYDDYVPKIQEQLGSPLPSIKD